MAVGWRSDITTVGTSKYGTPKASKATIAAAIKN
jgi:hypothetical protein